MRAYHVIDLISDSARFVGGSRLYVQNGVQPGRIFVYRRANWRRIPDILRDISRTYPAGDVHGDENSQGASTAI